MKLKVRRNQFESRFEMTPLLDVIFLLLTFFIYSLMVMVQAEILPIKLPALSASETKDIRVLDIVGIAISKDGQIMLNKQPVSDAVLDEALAKISKMEKKPAVFVAVDHAPSEIDRGPMFIALIDKLRRYGIKDFNIVGQKQSGEGVKLNGGE